MKSQVLIKTVAFIPDYYDPNEYIPEALESARIYVYTGKDEQHVTLSLEVNGETKVLAMGVCAEHASVFIEGYLHGMEIGYAVAEELAGEEQYERSLSK